MPYPPPTRFLRTEAQKRDQKLSWARDDHAFFAAGACHILTYARYELHPDGQIVYTHPLGKYPGNHVYVRVADWAFDFAGWTREDEILSVMLDAYEPLYPGWQIELLDITRLLLTEFCRRYDNRLPEQYAHLPWDRARGYLRAFPEIAPVRA
jgi:hypothetical protein